MKSLKNHHGDTTSAKIIGENENVVRIMSIHKSKGLEFPIVFLSGTGKQFNFKDLNKDILIHQDLGFGPKYVNYERKIEYSTLAREAIKLYLKNEIISEEMRVLYVALTRARQKLIITGIDKDYNKSIEQKKIRVSNNKKIDKTLIRKSKSYLDWLEMIALKCSKDMLNIQIHSKNIEDEKDLIEDDKSSSLICEDNFPYEYKENIESKLNWEYPYKDIISIEGKTSVSKLSHDKEEQFEISAKPKFMEEKKLSGAEKGTLIHLVLQKLDFSKTYNKEDIKELLFDLVKRQIILEEEMRFIDIDKIFKFTQSNLYKRAQNAKHIFKEEPFYIAIPTNKYENENILVQGIIDLYFVEENGNVVLVDYKTDYVENKSKGEEALVEKYKKQIDLYKEALEKSLGKKIEEKYIYSTYLSTEIRI